MSCIDSVRERKAQNNPEIYAPIEKSNKSFLQAVAISCKTPFSKRKGLLSSERV
jgi:hypothetical protein